MSAVTNSLCGGLRGRFTQTIRNIGAADALVSMLTLQAAMLASFQDKNNRNTNQMNAVTGLSVCILISILGISMIWYAWKKKKES